MALRAVMPATDQRRQPSIERTEEVGSRERPCLERGKLDRQRQSIQSAADGLHHFAVLAPAAGGAGLQFEHLDGVARREWLDRDDLLAGDPHRDPGGDEELEARRGIDKVGDRLRASGDALRIVEDQQPATLCSQREPIREADRIAYCGPQLFRLRDGDQVNERDRAIEAVAEPVADLDRQPCLADAAGPDQGDDALPGGS